MTPVELHMPSSSSLGMTLLVVGVAIAAIGVVLLIGPSIPGLGKLPGDIRLENENFRFYFPVATCIVLSVVISAAIWLFRFFNQ